MSTTLDPRIAAKLDAFAHRRRRLIIFRGVCAAFAMLLGAMMLVALIDWFFVLPDGLRWGLSVAAYIAVVVVAWRACLRILLQVPDSRRLARLIENAEPALREELLSAVELGQGSGEWDSPQFRALVQEEVSERVAGLQIERILPAVLMRGAVVALVVMLVLCLVALVVPSLRFGALLARALAPGANLDRVSSVQVKIIQPSPAEMAVPQGDSVPLLVELSGRRVNNAYLETFTKSGGRSVVQLQPVPGGRFSAGIQVSREDVQYRVRAFDAITRKYKLQAAARPSVVSFHKEYHYPKYTELPPKIVDEEAGDLTGVEGTEVELAVKANQPVKTAVLSIEAGHKTVEIPLQPRADGMLTATIPLKTAGVFRVELVSAATGFENKFNPEYELRVSPDTIPQVTLKTPERDIIASANEVIGITATALDDIAVVRVEQQIKVNDGKWTSRELSKQRGAEVKIDERWDLFKQGVHPGDSITTKLVAVDCKGNRGESRPVAITIAAAGFDRARLEALAAEQQLLRDLDAWQASTDALEKKHGVFRQLIEHNPAEEPVKRRAALADFLAATDQCATLAAAAQGQIVTTLRLATPGHETANLVLLSRLVAQGEAQLHFLPRQFQAAGLDPLPEFARDLSRAAAESCAWLGRRGKQAVENDAKLLTAEEIDLINENLQVIVREQNRLATMAQSSGNEAAKWQPVAGRMKVVLAEVASTEEAMKAVAAGNKDYTGDRITKVQRRLTDQRNATLAPLAAPVPGRDLLAPAVNLAKAAGETNQIMLEVKRDHDVRALAAIQQWIEYVEPSWIGFDKLKQEIEDNLRPEKTPEEVRGSLADGRWEARAAIWKSYGDAEEVRPDADSAFVKDVRSLSLALDTVHEELVTPGPVAEREAGWKKIYTLDQAYRILETAHDLTQLASGFDLLATSERYQTGSLRGRTSNVTDYFRLSHRLRAVPVEINRANLKDPDTRKISLEAARMIGLIPNDEAARKLDEEMHQRMRVDREDVVMTAPSERVAMLIRGALAALKPAILEARAALNATAPKLQERMAQLAKEAQKLQADNAEKAADKAEKPPEKAKSEAKQNLAQQQKLNDKVDALKDAIRAEANLQNVLDKEGREKARDADDALAMLKEPPVKAEQALDEAVKAERPSEQKDAMKAAANQDQKLADALDQLAKHYEALDKGEADKTRLALREEEKKLGVKEDLDQQFAKAEELAKAADATPQGMLEQLEKALPQNPLMRQELSNVSRDLLDKANQQLAAASKQESTVAKELEKMAAQPPPPKPPTPAAKAPDAQTPPNGDKTAAAKPPTPGEKAPDAQTPPNGDKTAAAKPPTPGDKAPDAQTPANGDKTSAAKPPTPGEKAPDAQTPPNGDKTAAAKPPSPGEKAPDAQTPPNGDKTAAAKPPTPGEKAPDAQTPANGDKTAAAKPPTPGENPAGAPPTPPAGDKTAAAQQPPAQNPAQPNAPPPAPNPALAKAAEQQRPIAKNAQEAGENVERAGRHEERLKNPQTGQELQKLGADVQATAQKEVPKAGEALAKADAAPQAQDAVGAADQELKKDLNRLAMAQGLAPATPDAATPPQGATPPTPPAPDAGATPPPGPTPPAGAQPPPAGAPPAGAPPAGAPPAGAPPAGAPPAGAPPAGAPPAGAPPAGAPPAGAPPPAPGEPDAATQLAANTPASPQQQVWMARALDALDAALHAAPPTAPAQDGANGQPQPPPPGQGQPQPGQPQPGQPGQPGQPQPGSQAAAEAAKQAQQAMAAAAQAAAAEMRANRTPPHPGQPESDVAKGGEQAKSETGAKADGSTTAYGKLPTNGALAQGTWGKLPKQMAEQLNQGQREAVSAEYQKEVETYYRVIAERARKAAK